MTSREDLLEAIRSKKEEDTPRLLYADYLEEFGRGDIDAATVEFVRVACPVERGKAKWQTRMPLAAYDWLYGNWDRLVPSYAATLERPTIVLAITGRKRPMFFVNGRVVETYWKPPQKPDTSITVRHFSVRLVFWKGFLVNCPLTTRVYASQILALLRTDQPLVECHTMHSNWQNGSWLSGRAE